MSRHKNTQAGPSQRQLRVGEQLKHIIAETLQRGSLQHPDLGNVAMLTVTEVRPSPDMRQATAYVVSLLDQDIQAAIHALNEESHVFQKEIGRQMSMKFTPRIAFKPDDSFENSQRINQLLDEIKDPE
ncbi:MAG: ribosome-binding factor A [Alphaproteobacteria bacterium]|nr:ribosome-binding factor A [Alphaproteobacteria bacterium]|tara:strand:+ start:15093 stop:15476 length:384 start_codon:yes stop_codon:yes gene_type:complete